MQVDVVKLLPVAQLIKILTELPPDCEFVNVNRVGNLSVRTADYNAVGYIDFLDGEWVPNEPGV
jgi:hypothetical protein